MGIQDHRESLDALHVLIGGSSDSGQWATGSEPMAEWQRGVLTRIRALTIDDDIRYLSSAKLDTGDWDFVAFTPRRVVRVLVTSPGSESVRFETTAFSRSSLESLELLDVEAIPEADEPWPVDINLIGHYRAGSVPLPLDRFASSSNKRDLSALLRSLMDDLAD